MAAFPTPDDCVTIAYVFVAFAYFCEKTDERVLDDCVSRAGHDVIKCFAVLEPESDTHKLHK